SESTVELQARIARFPRCLGGEVLRHVRRLAAGLARIEKLTSAKAHEVRRLELDEGLGDRKLHALVLSDGAAEDDPLARVLRHAVDEPVSIADAFGGDDRALRVEAVEDVAESTPF